VWRCKQRNEDVQQYLAAVSMQCSRIQKMLQSYVFLKPELTYH
jgi:hypothetical protein